MPIRQDFDTGPLTESLGEALTRTLSSTRWRTYQRAASFDDDLALKLYLWNAALGQSFHFPLQVAEVSLRNVINNALAEDFGVEWCFEANCLSKLHPKQRQAITKAADRHLKKYGEAAETSNIVASVTFGFWTALLRREYDRKIWDRHSATAFPYLGAKQGMADIRATAAEVQDLRNRIFHHEPLLGHNLLADYGAIIRLVGWMCQRTKNWTKKRTSVPAVIRQRPS